MSDEDDDWNRRDVRRRVTLTFTRTQLALPGEEESAAQTATPGEAAETRRDSDRPGTHDAWAAPATSDGDTAAEKKLADVRRGSALDLVERSHPVSATSASDVRRDMAERFALGDFTGALRAADILLGRDPNDAAAQAYATTSREKLEALVLSRIGALEDKPVDVSAEEEISWMGLDRGALDLLSDIANGVESLEELLAKSTLPRLDALKLVAELLQANAIRMERK